MSTPTELRRDPATPEEIERARAEYAHGSDDCLEVDDDACTSRAPDGSGTWVQAWVWLATVEPDCSACGDGAQIDNTCDACGERHCQACAPCGETTA